MTRRSLVVLALLAACEGRFIPTPAQEASAPREEARAGESPALQAAMQAGVRARGANEASYEVDAFVAALVVEELAAGVGGLRVEPALAGGVQAGYRIAEVEPGSAGARIGLQAGDIVEAIDGVPLDGPARATTLLAARRGTTLSVRRGEVGFSIELRIVGGLAWDEVVRTRGGVPPEAGVPGEETRSFEAEPPAVATDPPRSPVTGSPARPARPASGPAPEVAAVVQCSSASSCSIDRRTFDAAVKDPNRLLQQVAVAPARGGYKLTRVAPNSTVSQLGFRTGDTLISVNGSRLDDDVAALALYMGLGSTRNFVVTYERAGVRATKTIALRG